jgi:hypothetical protein
LALNLRPAAELFAREAGQEIFASFCGLFFLKGLAGQEWPRFSFLEFFFRRLAKNKLKQNGFL